MTALTRRGFCAATAQAAALLATGRQRANEPDVDQVMTVSGPVAASDLGLVLVHEHLLVDFIGAEEVTPERYDVDEVATIMAPFLESARDAGCHTLFECTPAYLGRDVKLLKRLSDTTGVQLVTNTGYYGAVMHKYLPAHAHSEPADALASRWIREAREGVEGTEVRPGFIKIGVDAGPLSPVNRKILEAAARTHRATGLTIAAHTGDGVAALEQLSILEKEGVSPSAWIWVHAQNESRSEKHIEAASRGAWVEFDGIGPETTDRHVELIDAMRRAGRLEQVLVSQDAGWYHVGAPRGGEIRPLDYLLRSLPAALARRGMGQEVVRQLLQENPARAMSIRRRLL